MKSKSIETFIYGRKPLEEAIKSGQTIDRILVNFSAGGRILQSIYKMAGENNISVKKISSQKFNTLVSKDKNHQGIVGVINSFHYTDIDNFLLDLDTSKAQILILDHLEDPHNLGAVIRTAESAAFDAVVIPTRKAALVNDTVVKTSAGAVFHIPIIKVDNLNQTIEQLKEANIFIFGTMMSGINTYYEANFNIPFALLIGNEGRGINKSLQKMCDEMLKIPMYGKLNSLNASVSAAIVIFEAVRQRASNGNSA